MKEMDRVSVLIISTCDKTLALLALLILSPALIVVVLVLRFTGEGQVLYKQKRVGRNLEEIEILKFATMLKDSPNIGSGGLTIRGDPRVLPYTGQFLRKSKLNEIPQLFNVLRGDISLIGPRPQTVQFFECYSVESRKSIVTVHPGLSGLSSVIFRDEETIISLADDPVLFDRETLMPYKGRLEEWFVKNRSLGLYFRLIVLTVLRVLAPNLAISLDKFTSLPEMPNEIKELIRMAEGKNIS